MARDPGQPQRPLPLELAGLSPAELAALEATLNAAPDSDGRSQLLRNLRLENPRRAAQLLRLIEWRDPPTNFLNTPLLPRGLFTPQESALQPGQLLDGRYRVERLLGSGGMGDVYSAFDSHHQRQIALKTLRPEILGDTAMLKRFRREFSLASRIEHGNVCRVHEFREAEGIAFIAMELLNGPTLSEHLKTEGPLSPDAALPIVSQMLHGIGQAHAQSIVHRDLKPGNVNLCTTPAGELRVVITDFGLARTSAHSQDSVSISTSLTGAGNIIGTLSYMAPEVLTGSDATFASDIYAIGVMMYEVVTGRRPFEGASPFVPALRCLTEAAPDPTLLVPGLDKRWTAAIRDCLQLDPARRPKTTAAVLETLESKPTKRFRWPFWP